MNCHHLPDEDDRALTDSLCESLERALEDIPLPQRNVTALMVAARLTENAAYNLANEQAPQNTAALILLAAELDRMAERQNARKKMPFVV